MKKQGLCVGGCGYRGKCACGTGFEKPKTKPKKLSDHYWADFVHLEDGKMVAVIEGFDTLEQAIELVEKARELGLGFTKPKKKPTYMSLSFLDRNEAFGIGNWCLKCGCPKTKFDVFRCSGKTHYCGHKSWMPSFGRRKGSK